MLAEILHWTLLVTGIALSLRYFRDMGDITQAVFNVQRRNIIFAIRNEGRLIVVALACLAGAATLGIGFEAGIRAIWSSAFFLGAFLISWPWIWIHVGLRNQQKTARYFPIAEARNFIRPETSVFVVENNGEARAHTDFQMGRPHIAGTPEGLGGDEIIMTYCSLAHLGQACKPEFDGKPVSLEVMGQHGNNLIFKDEASGEPIQQIYGTRECDGRWSETRMPEVPTFRMTFRGFQRAFPEGEVFLNPIVPFNKNPLLCFFDNLVEAIFAWGLTPHHETEALLFETMDHEDDRLPRKELVWGVSIDGDSAAFTEQFVRERGNLLNATVGGHKIVLVWDETCEALGAWYNTSEGDILSIDIHGKSDQGDLSRVEGLKAGLYWCVWINYFPESDLNRLS